MAVLDFIGQHSLANTVLAVDCSLIVANTSGQRPCETLVAKAFGRYHASCHTTTRGHLYWQTGPRLVRLLRRRGFAHGIPLERDLGRSGRWFIEVYPHPAMVRLFGLDRILQYKKGSVASRRQGLRQLANLVGQLPGLRRNPLLASLLGRDLSHVKGQTLKRHEDSLDAVFCAYLAWHAWRWGARRNDVFGDLDSGYIVVPGG